LSDRAGSGAPGLHSPAGLVERGPGTRPDRSRYAILREIQALDPERDHQRIMFLSTCYEFPFDTTRALEFALFRTFGVPSISALLDRTGEFGSRSQKRYDDTDLIVSELIEWGYDSDRGTRALRRMNQLHGRFVIANDDFLYVLSTFVFEPIRWNARFGWRPMCETERLGYFHFWRQVGRRMNIRDIPAEYQAFERFNREYERVHYRFTEANQRVGRATRELFASWLPRVLAPAVRSVVHALLEEPLLEAFGFPRPSRVMRWLVPAGLRLRGRVVRWMPPRRRPRLRTEMGHPSYPGGHTIERLGPPGT
jgi:ER-bound oxygenase mpaB/B'/Rubber oxygenase, catalytic domain